MIELRPSVPSRVSHTGGYEAFVVSASDGAGQTLAAWRSAKAYGHVADPNATIRGALSTDSRTLGEPRQLFDDGDPTTSTSPAGLAWDARGKRWVILGHVTMYDPANPSRAKGYRGIILTSPDGFTWTRTGDVSVPSLSWWYGSNLTIDGDTWVIAGYGGRPGVSGWIPFTSMSKDAGATWSDPAVPTGLPARRDMSEPQLLRTPRGWIMSIRCDDDWTTHIATSADATSWVYEGAAVTGVSGSPSLGMSSDGIIVMLLRQRPPLSAPHGLWAYATSRDNGLTWVRHDDFPGGGLAMMYGALTPSPDGLLCVFASEDDVAVPWKSASVYALTFERREVRDALPEAARNAPVSSPRAAAWRPPAWRFFATRLRGDGTETMLHPDLPLADVEPEFVLSGTPGLRATIPVEVANLTDAGLDVLVAWSTVIWVELGGRARGAWILTDVEKDGPKLSLTGVGFVGFAKGTPYGGEKSFIDTDALDVFRHVWEHIQAQPGANLGMTLGGDKSGVLLGRQSVDQLPLHAEGSRLAVLPPEGTLWRYQRTKTPAKPAVTVKKTDPKTKKVTVTTTPAKPAVVETLYGESRRAVPKPIPAGAEVILRDRKTTVVRWLEGPEDGFPQDRYDVVGLASKRAPKQDTEGEQLEPFTLAWYADADLGAKLDTICEQGNFDYVEDHSWDGDAPRHVLRFAAPRAGRVRGDLRFVVGENIVEAPALTEKAEQIATEVVVLGAGEGRAMVRGTWKTSAPGRLRRVKTVTDKSLRTKADADARAAREGKAATLGADIASIVVRDHPNAPLGSWGLGDTITARGDGQGWAGDWTMQLRIISYTLSPDKDTATLTVARGEVTT